MKLINVNATIIIRITLTIRITSIVWCSFRSIGLTNNNRIIKTNLANHINKIISQIRISLKINNPSPTASQAIHKSVNNPGMCNHNNNKYNTQIRISLKVNNPSSTASQAIHNPSVNNPSTGNHNNYQ